MAVGLHNNKISPHPSLLKRGKEGENFAKEGNWREKKI